MLRRPLEPRRGLDGLPIADAREERISRLVLYLATAWFTLAASWELFGPMLAGHYASSASMGIIAENMLRWHIAGPVWEYTKAAPPPEMYYCHHPWGIFWVTAGLLKVFGRHDFICRLAPVILSAVTPALLYGIGRAVWRPAAGAAAAAAFVVLPITLAFANFNALEVPVMAWSLLGLWGLVRLTQTGKRRFLAASLAGALVSLHSDWPAFVLWAVVLGFALVRGFIAPGLFGRLASPRRYMTWWAFAVVGSVATLVLYLWLFQRSHKLDDLFGAYGQRSSGNAIPLAKVLESRRYWIELSFTPIAIALGKVAAVVCVLRLLWLRREHEVLALGLLAMATVQYVVFHQGADIHIFWPQYFGAFFALGMGALVATLAPAIEKGRALFLRAKKRAPSPYPVAGLLALGVSLVPVLAIARDGVPALRYARGTGGRFNEKGLLIHSDGAKTAFLAWLGKEIERFSAVDMHDGMKATWSQVWTLHKPINASRPLPARGKPSGEVYLADTRFLGNDQQAELAKQFHVKAVGPFWEVLPGEPTQPIDGFSIVETEPSWWEWYFVSGSEPHRVIVPDPYRTWELRTHFGQAAEVPKEAPVTLDQKRIAHNIAVEAGDAARAATLLAEIEREVSPVHVAFDDGSELAYSSYHDGARPLLSLWFRAAGPTSADAQVVVRSKVLEKATLSTTIADPLEREVGIPLGLSPQRWRKGFLYVDPVPIRKRPGAEVYRASVVLRSGKGAVPRPIKGPGAIDVLTLR